MHLNKLGPLEINHKQNKANKLPPLLWLIIINFYLKNTFIISANPYVSYRILCLVMCSFMFFWGWLSDLFKLLLTQIDNFFVKIVENSLISKIKYNVTQISFIVL